MHGTVDPTQDAAVLKDLAHGSRVAFWILWHGFLLPFRMLLLGSRRPVPEILAGSVVDLLQKLGSPYVKLGQVLSTRLADLPPCVTARLASLQDDVKANRRSLSKPDLNALLGSGEAERFHLDELRPIAHGSIATVYRTRLKNGPEVAIKIVRSESQASIERMFSCLKRFYPWVERMFRLADLPLREALQDLERATLLQCDLHREAKINEKLQRVFQREPRVRLPKIRHDLSNKHVITMEFIPGLTKIDSTGSGGTLDHAFRTGFEALFRMILEHGVIHCDFHPGNVFFAPDGYITILDTGFAEELIPRERLQFFEFFIGLFRNEGKRCADVIWESAHKTADWSNRGQFTDEMSELVRNRSRAKAAEFHVSEFVHEMFAIQRKNGVRGSHRFTLVIFSLLVYEGIAARHVPGLDFQNEAWNIIGPILVQRSF